MILEIDPVLNFVLSDAFFSIVGTITVAGAMLELPVFAYLFWFYQHSSKKFGQDTGTLFALVAIAVAINLGFGIAGALDAHSLFWRALYFSRAIYTIVAGFIAFRYLKTYIIDAGKTR